MAIQDKARELAQQAGFDVPGKQTGENITFQPVRQTPKGTRIEAEAPGSITIRFKAVIRTWWILPWLLIPGTIFLSLPTGLFIGIYLNPFNGFYSQGAWQSWQSFWVLVTPLLFLAATIISYRLTHLWVKLVATPNHIQVGPYYFDRTKYGGMRLGYEITGKSAESMLKNDFHDISIGMQALRLSYGLWGEDLPYLVNKYHANEIVLWLNIMIARTIAKPAGATDIETGQRKQVF